MVVVGKLKPTRQLDIIACEQEKGVESVRYGIIQNPEATSMRIQRIIDLIQQRPGIQPRKITSVFVGLSGRSIRSISTTVHKNLPEDTEISDDIIASLRTEALQTALDSSIEVVDAIPRVFTVGKTETSSPKGMVGNRISGIYDLIVCRPEMKRNLMRTLHDKLGIGIDGAIVTALSTSQLILTTEEKRLGCMLVDMGAETTTVTIFKEGHLHYFATLPLGGRNITRDITSIPTPILEERAEDLKISSGDAIMRESVSTLNINGVNMADISNRVVARSEEIVANVVEQISYAGLTERDLPGGIICIGGASQLRGMKELLSTKSSLSVRRGQLPNYIRIEDSKVPLLEIIEVASVLYTGAVNSNVESLSAPVREEPRPDEEPDDSRNKDKERKKKPKTKGLSLSNWISGFFKGEEDSDLYD